MNGYEHTIDQQANKIENLEEAVSVRDKTIADLQVIRVELLEEVRALNKRCTNLSKGYDRVKAEKKELEEKVETEKAFADGYENRLNNLLAINDNLREQLSHYKAIAGLNEPDF